jgi:DNA-binding MarR family transcriptional regulator
MPTDTAGKLATLSTACTCAAIRQASRHVTQLYDECLEPYGLTVTQFSILSRLNRSGPKSINALAREMLTDRTTLARNLRPLEREGLLKLEANESDARSRSLIITAEGVKRVKAARAGWQKAQTRFEEAYGAERATALRTLLHAAVEIDLGGSARAAKRQAR